MKQTVFFILAILFTLTSCTDSQKNKGYRKIENVLHTYIQWDKDGAQINYTEFFEIDNEPIQQHAFNFEKRGPWGTYYYVTLTGVTPPGDTETILKGLFWKNDIPPLVFDKRFKSVTIKVVRYNKVLFLNNHHKRPYISWIIQIAIMAMFWIMTAYVEKFNPVYLLIPLGIATCLLLVPSIAPIAATAWWIVFIGIIPIIIAMILVEAFAKF